MEEVYDSDLIGGLGDLLGLDPYVTEEADFSSLYAGEIGKQGFDLTSQYGKQDYTSELPGAQPDEYSGSSLEGLLSEGTQLLEQLMVQNGVQMCSDSTVDLSSIDELSAAGLPTNCPDLLDDLQYTEPTLTEPTLAELISQLTPVDDEQFLQPTCSSPVSTLPSEPSSPVDLFSLIDASPVVSPAPTECFAPSPVDSIHDETFTDILASLVDDEAITSPQHSPMDYMAWSPDQSESDMSVSSSPVDNSYEEEYKPVKKARSKKQRSTPYSKLPSTKKERKKLQNKEAANRYRQKKKNESLNIQSEEDQLLKRNTELKSDVLNLQREIMCLKDLLSDVFDVNSL